MSIRRQSYVLKGHQFDRDTFVKQVAQSPAERDDFGASDFYEEYRFPRSTDTDTDVSDIVNTIGVVLTREYVYVGELLARSTASTYQPQLFGHWEVAPEILTDDTDGLTRTQALLAEYRVPAGEPSLYAFTQTR